MPNIYERSKSPDYESTRLGEQAGAEHLGMSLYQIPPDDGIVFHYHLQREELLIVLSGRISLRTAEGWNDVPEGEVVAFPRGERGAHGFENRGDEPVRVLVISELNAPQCLRLPRHQRGRHHRCRATFREPLRCALQREQSGLRLRRWEGRDRAPGTAVFLDRTARPRADLRCLEKVGRPPERRPGTARPAPRAAGSMCPSRTSDRRV